MATEIPLKLSSRGYAAFLVDFRTADTRNAAGHEIVVTYESHRYFFRVPNFRLVGYSVWGGARIDLTEYNYGANEKVESAATKEVFEKALAVGGNGSTRMNESLASVIALTSEAARSRLVEKKMIAMLIGGTVDLGRLRPLFKDYGQVAVFCRYRLGQDKYSPTWRPLDKSDYQRFYTRREYTGDRAAALADITTL